MSRELMCYLSEANKDQFIQLAKDEFEKYSQMTQYRKPGYTLKNAVTDAVKGFHAEHGRWPKVFEYLLYTSRMFAKYSPDKTNDTYCIWHIKNGERKMGKAFARIEAGNIKKLLNFIAFDSQNNGPDDSQWVTKSKHFFENIQVYPDNLKYKENKEAIPEYIKLRD